MFGRAPNQKKVLCTRKRACIYSRVPAKIVGRRSRSEPMTSNWFFSREFDRRQSGFLFTDDEQLVLEPLFSAIEFYDDFWKKAEESDTRDVFCQTLASRNMTACRFAWLALMTRSEGMQQFCCQQHPRVDAWIKQLKKLFQVRVCCVLLREECSQK